MSASALRQSDLFTDAPHESDLWSERLLAAFADANLDSGFLPLAEQAIAACPGDPMILLLAATAALLDERRSAHWSSSNVFPNARRLRPDIS